MAIKVGCRGWPVAPAKYFEALGPVEIQESFYNLPPICRQLDLIHCVDPFQRRSVWGEEVPVARHHETRLGLDCGCKELVVVRIAARLDLHSSGHERASLR